MKIRRVIHRDGLTISNKTQNILIIDSARDQSIISTNSFVILPRSCTSFYINGTLSSNIEAEFALEVVDTVTLITLQKNRNLFCGSTNH